MERLRLLERFYKIFALDAGLRADSAQVGILNFFKTFAPKVWIWKSNADLVSARASSYVFPSPTTTPSMPNGYPTYPSSSLDITIFIHRCILLLSLER